MNKKLWTDQDEQFLRDNYSVKGGSYCAKELDRTLPSIKLKASRLNIPGKFSTKLKTHEEYLENLHDKCIMLTPLDNYVNNSTPIRHQCLKGHIWSTKPSHILQGSGCPHCSSNIKRTTKSYQETIKYKVLEEYINSHTKIKHECSEGHIWHAAPTNILSGTGCPFCNIGSYNIKLPGTLYYIRIDYQGRKYYKIGVTNNSVASRFRSESHICITILYEHTFIDGAEAKELESSILYEFKHLIPKDISILRNGGNTELFTRDVLGFDQ